MSSLAFSAAIFPSPRRLRSPRSSPAPSLCTFHPDQPASAPSSPAPPTTFPHLVPLLLPAAPRRRALQSLPTTRERRWLAERRVLRADGAPVYTARSASFILRVWQLVVCGEGEGSGGRRRRGGSADEERPLRIRSASTLNEEEAVGVLAWAYIARVKTSKFTLGKKAVVRNRGKRRIVAALRVVMPEHAVRGREYVVSVLPGALVAPLDDLTSEVEEALKVSQSWAEELEEEETRRPRYTKRRP